MDTSQNKKAAQVPGMKTCAAENYIFKLQFVAFL